MISIIHRHKTNYLPVRRLRLPVRLLSQVERNTM